MVDSNIFGPFFINFILFTVWIFFFRIYFNVIQWCHAILKKIAKFSSLRIYTFFIHLLVESLCWYSDLNLLFNHWIIFYAVFSSFADISFELKWEKSHSMRKTRISKASKQLGKGESETAWGVASKISEVISGANIPMKIG